MDRINQWLANAIGRAMNPDGAYGYQCKDVADDYCMFLFGNWKNTIRPGDAHTAFAKANPEYFNKIKNIIKDSNCYPQRGDIIVWPSVRGNPYGHIAVVLGADVNGVTVVEQNGSTNWLPSRKHWYKHGVCAGAPATGWLRPRLEKIVASQSNNNNSKGDYVNTIKSMYLRLLGREADDGGIKHYQNIIKTKGFEFAYLDLKNSAEGQKDWTWRNPEAVRKLEADLKSKTVELAKAKQALLDEQAKPPKVIEKIVEKPVEKIVYVDKIVYKDRIVEKPCEQSTTVENWFAKLIKKLLRK